MSGSCRVIEAITETTWPHSILSIQGWTMPGMLDLFLPSLYQYEYSLFLYQYQYEHSRPPPVPVWALSSSTSTSMNTLILYQYQYEHSLILYQYQYEHSLVLHQYQYEHSLSPLPSSICLSLPILAVLTHSLTIHSPSTPVWVRKSCVILSKTSLKCVVAGGLVVFWCVLYCVCEGGGVVMASHNLWSGSIPHSWQPLYPTTHHLIIPLYSFASRGLTFA